MNSVRTWERHVVGCTMLDSNLLNDVILKVGIDTFSYPYKDILRAIEIKRKNTKRSMFSPGDVHRQLSTMGKEEISLGDIVSIHNETTDPEDFDHSISNLVNDRARKITRDSMDRINAIVDSDKSASEILIEIDENRSQISKLIERGNDANKMPLFIKNVFNRLRKSRDGVGISGIPSGYKSLDDITSGFHGGQLIIIAGRPGMGKTSLSLGMVRQSLFVSRIPVAFFSYEMQGEGLLLRNVTYDAGMNVMRVRKNEVTDWDFEELRKSLVKYEKCGLFFLDDRLHPMERLISKIEALVLHKKIKMVFIDYLQLIYLLRKAESRAQEVSITSKALKELAKHLNIPIIALSQMNRVGASRHGSVRRPELQDLRDSGSIEQDADVVIFVHRPSCYGVTEVDGQPMENIAEIIVAKQRDGPTGIVNLYFDSRTGSFENLTSKSLRFSSP